MVLSFADKLLTELTFLKLVFLEKRFLPVYGLFISCLCVFVSSTGILVRGW